MLQLRFGVFLFCHGNYPGAPRATDAKMSTLLIQVFGDLHSLQMTDHCACSLRVRAGDAGTMLSSQMYRDAGLVGLKRFSAANGVSAPSYALIKLNAKNGYRDQTADCTIASLRASPP